MTSEVKKEPIVVMGASRGIGEAVSRHLLNEGEQVVLVARDGEKLKKIQSEHRQNATIVEWDLSELDEIENLVKKITSEKGPVKGLVCTIGAQKTLPISMSKPDKASWLFNINALAPIEIIRCLSKKKHVSPDGASFVLFSSLAAHEGAMGKSLYGATKGALEGFIPPAAAELAQKKIRLNCVTMGIVKTDMSQEFLGRMTEEQIAKLEKTYPLGIGETSDITGMVEFLLSSRSSWITGQSFVVDGGHTIRS